MRVTFRNFAAGAAMLASSVAGHADPPAAFKYCTNELLVNNVPTTYCRMQAKDCQRLLMQYKGFNIQQAVKGCYQVPIPPPPLDLKAPACSPYLHLEKTKAPFCTTTGAKCVEFVQKAFGIKDPNQAALKCYNDSKMPNYY